MSNKFPVLQVDFVPRLDTSDDSAAFVRACALGIVAIASAIAGAVIRSSIAFASMKIRQP